MVFTRLTLALTACLAVVSAAIPPIPVAPRIPLEEAGTGTTAASPVVTGFFDQLIDHDNPSLGTFKQRWYYSLNSWAGPGSPIVFFTPGEIASDGYEGYLTNRTLTGVFAQNIKGANIMIEHRYYGQSSPYTQLTVKNLQHLTLKNAIADMVYFARNVKLPFDTSGKTNAPNAPWVLSGGSYSGALSAWTEKTSPGTFWAYHSTSAPVEAIYDYWAYFYPVQEGMPQNCSNDVQKVIEYVDLTLLTGSTSQKNALKAKFGLPGLADDDFASGLQNGPWAWQGNSFVSGYSTFYQFCDWVENAVDIGTGASINKSPSANGVGLSKALDGYAAWIKTQAVPGTCASYGDGWTSATELGCFNTYNKTSPMFTDISVGNPFNRQWNWMLCNEPFAYWQDGAPLFEPSLVSRYVTAGYWQRQCGLFFPTESDSSGTYTYGSARGASVATENAYTAGWYNTDTTRLLYVTGQYDPWLTSGVGSPFRPGGPLQSSTNRPVLQVPNGIHCSDLSTRNAVANAGVQAVVNQEVAIIKGWVGEFYSSKAGRRRRR